MKAIGLRPISTLVDITNYFTYDQNRPLHVFDADKIGGKTLKVHKATGGEKFIGLDEKEYTLTPGMVAISDSIGVESFQHQSNLKLQPFLELTYILFRPIQ